MAHNNEKGGSYTRLTNLTTDEAKILAENHSLAPLAWHLPHG
jgi:hypothetical protein